MSTWFVAVEDALSLSFAKAIILSADETAEIQLANKMGGNGELKKNLGKLNKVAQQYPVLVLTDLDRVVCAPVLIDEWFGRLTFRGKKMVFRVAVTEIESWLLADSQSMAAFLNVPLNKIPLMPDALPNPKQTLLQLSKRYAPKELKADLVQAKGGELRVGLGYNNRLVQFVENHWNVNRAILNSDSLSRAHRRVKEAN